jgi:eukaryotic-like serine/threonine-protein kinase
VPYLVTELVDGRTLRQALEPVGTRLPVRRAIDIGLQMAQALAAAHARGIFHRDLKPENVIVSADGRVKVLDFGLARLVEQHDQQAIASTAVGTNPGMALGTPGYMAPEQVRGQAVDARADLFALGCVLYEMIAGRRAFTGDTGADAMSAVLKDDPPELGSGRGDVPPALERIVHRCLEKDAAARFQGAADLAFALQTLTGSTSARAETTAEPRRATTMTIRERLAWAVAVAGIAGAATAAWGRFGATATTEVTAARAMQAEIDLAQSATGFVSPDGQYIAFDNAEGVWLRRLDKPEPTRVLQEVGTQGVMCWSPDSRALAVHVNARMRIVSIPDGASRDVGPTAWIPTTCGWSSTGEVVFASQLIPMIAIRIADGTSRPLTRTRVAGDVGRYDFGGFLPDNTHFVFRSTSGAVNGLYVGDLADRDEPVPLPDTQGRGIPLYAYGHLLWRAEGVLWARAFDTGRLVFSGEAKPLSSNLRGDNNRHGFSTSTTGTPTMTVSWDATVITQARMEIVDRQGRPTGTLAEDATSFSVAPKGAGVAIARAGGVWVTDIERPAPVRLTGSDGAFHGGVAWDPDGQSLYFTRNANSRPALFRRRLRTDAADEQIFEATGAISVNSQRIQATRAGLLVRAISRVPGASYDLMLLGPAGDLQPWVKTSDNEAGPSASPDGEWVAYDSDAGGEWNVYVRRLTGSAAPLRVTQAGGRNARWRGDGRELYYLAPTGIVTAVPVERTGDSLRFGEPTALFPMRLNVWFGDNPVLYPQFDVTPDGQRFVVRVIPEVRNAARLIVNWPALLQTPPN